MEEVPYYLPQGAGEHCYLFVEKEKLSTHEMVGIFSRQLGIKEKEIGVAGLKDSQAISRQWISLRSVGEALVSRFAHPQIRIMKIGRHRNKLRIGHLKGNRFHVRLRGVAAGDVPRVREVLDLLEQRGVPNYFGEQRFGVGRDNHLTGRAMFEGKIKNSPRKFKYFYLAAFQSHLFNRCLAKRLENMDRLYEGDLAFKHENGAVFRVQNPQEEKERLARFEISPSGPLFGTEMIEPTGEEQRLEDSILAEEGVSREFLRSPFRGIKLSGKRRPYRVPMSELSMSYKDSVLELGFFLPKGSYATVLLREILKEGVKSLDLTPSG